MHKYKIMFYSTIVVSLIMILYIQLLKLENDSKEKIILDSGERINSFTENLISHFENSFFYEGLSLNSIIFEDNIGNEFYLADILNDNRKKLFVHMVVPNCSSCYDSISTILNEFLNSHTKENIILFSTTMSNSDIYYFYDKTGISIPIYKLSHESYENFPLPKINLLYMFLTDKRQEIDLFFSPLLELPQVTSDYLNTFSDRYINEKAVQRVSLIYR